MLQIPAFLCRQTDLLVAAAKTNKIINVKNEDLIEFKAREYAYAINQVARNINSKIIVLSGSSNCKYLAPSLAIKFDAEYENSVTFNNNLYKYIYVGNSKKNLNTFNLNQ